MKIGIVGVGHVGSTAAFSLLLQGIGSEIVLVDHDPKLAASQVMDMQHATPFSHPIALRHGDFCELAGSHLVIVAAGVNQAPGESRTSLLSRNAAIFAEIIPQILRYAADAVLLVATNPLDVMTQIVTHIADLPAGRVLGTGTILDTARFRALLGQQYGVAPGSVHAYVLGEHGDSEVLLWSGVRIGGQPLERFASDTGQISPTQIRTEIDAGVRRAAYRIIEGKGSTYFGIGAAIATLSRCILFDERTVFTACSVVDELEDVRQVALSLPHVVGRNGIERTLMPATTDEERQALRASAAIIKENVSAVGY